MAQTIFGTEVPANLNNNDGDSYSLGTRFRPSVNGQATHGEWYFPTTTPSAPVQMGIYRDSDQVLLRSATFPGGESGGRSQVAFVPPVDLVATIDYTVVVWTPDRYVSTGGYFGTDKTVGDLYCPVTAGRFLVSPILAFPDQSFGNANYWPDLVFVPEGDDPAEGSAALTLDLAVVATGARNSEGVAALGLGLAVAATGSAPHGGSVALTLDLALAAGGSSPNGGVAALGLGLAVSSAGERESLGSAALGLGLAVAGTGARESLGAASLTLNLALSGAGSNGDIGCPVPTFPFTPRSVAVAWTPRAVRSFPGGECT